MKNEGDRFAESVLRNHILITGVELSGVHNPENFGKSVFNVESYII